MTRYNARPHACVYMPRHSPYHIPCGTNNWICMPLHRSSWPNYHAPWPCLG